MEGDSEVRKKGRAVVVAQLTAWSLLIPEDQGSNIVTGNFYITYLLFVENTKIKKKEAGNGTFFKKIFTQRTRYT